MIRSTTLLATLLVLLGWTAEPLSGQYFGRNKVTYEDFDFRVLETENFDVYHYGDTPEDAVRDFARMAERWYERLARTLQHTFEDRKPVIVYRNAPDFQQTNAIPGFISQATGGVTESVKNRVILPFGGSYGETDHVLGHELVHAFQYDLADAGRGGGQTTIGRAPLWFIEGMAEYLSLGRDYAHTAMWMRDAVARDSLPTIDDLTNTQEYFPYRFGHAFWAYVAGRWGDEAVGQLYRAVGQAGLDGAIERTLGVNPDTLSAQWVEDTKAFYRPHLQGKTPPLEAGERLLADEGPAGGLNLSPEVSPNGRTVALISRQDPFSVDLFLVDATTGELLGELASARRNPHFEALAFTNTSGAWSPDGTSFAFVTYRGGENRIALADVEARRTTRTLPVGDVGQVFDLAWSPDGSTIAFSGSRSGVVDLYTVSLDDGTVEALTDDRFTERHPAWSPDGTRLVFSTDRGPGADLERLTFPGPALGILDVAAGDLRVIRPFEGAKHIDPEFGPDGTSIYFISDRAGFSDVYRYALDDGRLFQVTELSTGVSGLTAMAPAMSVADETGGLVFTAFHSGEYVVTRIAADASAGVPVRPGAGTASGAAMLPPGADSRGLQMVSRYLDDPDTGLPTRPEWEVSDYHPGLQLDYLAQPTAGVSVDRFGTALGGSVAAYFSDMLGDHQLGVGVSANGGVQDIGGQAMYVNRSNRMSWGLQAGRIPYRSAGTRIGTTEVDGTTVRAVDVVIDRTILYRAAGMTEYPLSRTQRLEFSLGGTRMEFDREIRRDLVAPSGRLIGERELEGEAPGALSLGHASAAWVMDESQFGFTSPVAGERTRLELETNVGSLQFTRALVDHRRYFFFEPLTLGIRGLHFGRYGQDAESGRISPLFLGQQTFVRGYSFGSFSGSECTDVPGAPERCPEFDRLVGSRIAVANIELRVPLVGTEQFGLLDWGFLPLELSLFADAGIAWSSDETPTFELTRRSTERIPVLSAGVSLRANLFGRMVLEAFHARPFQRPERGGVWGFQVSPGW